MLSGVYRVSLLALVLLLLTAAVAPAETVAPMVVVSADSADEYNPSIVYNSNRDEYLAVWHQTWPFAILGEPFRIIVGQRLDRYGHPIGAAFRISPTGDDIDRMQSDVAYDPTHDRYVIVYLYDANKTQLDLEVRGRWIDGTGPNPGLPEFVIAQSEPIEPDQQRWRPRVEYSPVSGKYLVVWWEEGSPAYVMGAIGAFGSPPNGSVFNVAVNPSENRLSPDLAWHAMVDRFVVVHASPLAVYGIFVDAGTQVVGTEFFIAAAVNMSPAPAVATCNELQFMVTWHYDNSGQDDTLIQPRWLGDGSAAFPTPFQLASGSGGDQRFPAITCDVKGYLALFEQEYAPNGYGVWMQRIAPLNYIMSSHMPVRDVFSAEVGDPISSPAVAAGGPGWLAVWEHDRQPDAFFQDIHGAAIWDLFADGFEWGGVLQWSNAVP